MALWEVVKVGGTVQLEEGTEGGSRALVLSCIHYLCVLTGLT